jgi:hypothetical protein
VAQLLLKQFSKRLVCALSGGLVAADAPNQIGHLEIKPVRQDSVSMLGHGIADNA